MQNSQRPAPREERHSNLGGWSKQDREALHAELKRMPKWQPAELASRLGKPVVEVLWHLSALDAQYRSLRVSKPGSLIDRHPFEQCEEASDSEVEQEEAESRRHAKELDRALKALNAERTLTKREEDLLQVLHRRRATIAMSHHLNNGKPLSVMNDVWLEVHASLVAWLQPRVHDAVRFAEQRIALAHPTAHVVVDEIAEADIEAAVTAHARPRDTHNAARARELALWWATEYSPRNPHFCDELYPTARRAFAHYGIDLDEVRKWQPPAELAAKLATIDPLVVAGLVNPENGALLGPETVGDDSAEAEEEETMWIEPSIAICAPGPLPPHDTDLHSASVLLTDDDDDDDKSSDEEDDDDDDDEDESPAASSRGSKRSVEDDEEADGDAPPAKRARRRRK
ncbi:hypothetical protein H9P43_001885 [Blastocladiella emersonii ATCC 22665]|nr:hypothetical protein H9P43_001885 [Blastocladiella emersonii ATCC 22665]